MYLFSHEYVEKQPKPYLGTQLIRNIKRLGSNINHQDMCLLPSLIDDIKINQLRRQLAGNPTHQYDYKIRVIHTKKPAAIKSNSYVRQSTGEAIESLDE